MRDPNRIYKFMNRLTALWAKYPDWRLGQFMMNILGIYHDQTGRDPFFPEDEEFMKVLEDYFNGKE